MTKQLINKIIRDRIYDTKNYRYVSVETASGTTIKRIAIDALDTTAALSDASDTNPHGWVIVYTA